MTETKDKTASDSVFLTKFGPEAALRQWQENLVRVFRINDLATRSFFNLTKRQMELNQELLSDRLTSLQQLTKDGKPVSPADATKAQTELNLKQLERVAVEVRQELEDARHFFDESVKLLLAGYASNKPDGQ